MVEKGYIDNLIDIRNAIRQCLKKRYPNDTTIDTLSFLKFHQKLGGTENITLSKKLDPSNIIQTKNSTDQMIYINAVINAIFQEKTALKNVLTSKYKKDMTNKTFAQYSDIICSLPPAQTALATKIGIYDKTSSSIYNGHYLYFRLLDEKNKALGNKKLTITYDGKTTNITTNNSGIAGVVITTSKTSISVQASFAGESSSGIQTYKASSKKWTIGVSQSVKSKTLKPSRLSHSEEKSKNATSYNSYDTNAKSSGGKYKANSGSWKDWALFSPTGTSMCGPTSVCSDANAYKTCNSSYCGSCSKCKLIAGINGTHDMPTWIDVKFDLSSLQNATKITKISCTFQAQQWPGNRTLGNQNAPKISFHSCFILSNCIKSDYRRKGLSGVIHQTGLYSSSTPRTSDEYWTEKTISWTNFESGKNKGSYLKSNKTDGDFIRIGWSKNKNTNYGRLSIRGITLTISYVPADVATPTASSTFKY